MLSLLESFSARMDRARITFIIFERTRAIERENCTHRRNSINGRLANENTTQKIQKRLNERKERKTDRLILNKIHPNRSFRNRKNKQTEKKRQECENVNSARHKQFQRKKFIIEEHLSRILMKRSLLGPNKSIQQMHQNQWFRLASAHMHKTSHFLMENYFLRNYN